MTQDEANKKFTAALISSVIEFAKAARELPDDEMEKLPALIEPHLSEQVGGMFKRLEADLDLAVDGTLEAAAKLFLEIGRIQQPADIARILRSMKGQKEAA